MYFALKHIHMLCAVLSIVGFIIRGALRIKESSILEKKWIRIAPHIVDTVLLLSAVGLMFTINQYPFVNSWLTAKFLGLIAYILLGLVTMRFAKKRALRIVAYLAAINMFIYIAIVALSKSPVLF